MDRRSVRLLLATGLVGWRWRRVLNSVITRRVTHTSRISYLLSRLSKEGGSLVFIFPTAVK